MVAFLSTPCLRRRDLLPSSRLHVDHGVAFLLTTIARFSTRLVAYLCIYGMLSYSLARFPFSFATANLLWWVVVVCIGRWLCLCGYLIYDLMILTMNVLFSSNLKSSLVRVAFHSIVRLFLAVHVNDFLKLRFRHTRTYACICNMVISNKPQYHRLTSVELVLYLFAVVYSILQVDLVKQTQSLSSVSMLSSRQCLRISHYEFLRDKEPEKSVRSCNPQPVRPS